MKHIPTILRDRKQKSARTYARSIDWLTELIYSPPDRVNVVRFNRVGNHAVPVWREAPGYERAEFELTLRFGAGVVPRSIVRLGTP